MFETILLPINTLKFNLQKTEKAIHFARHNIVRLIILYFSEHQSASLNTSDGISYATSILKDLIVQNDVVCDVIHRRGKEAIVICEIADELNVDLIVMGAQGINLLKESQNITSRVIKTANCPVLIIP